MEQHDHTVPVFFRRQHYTFAVAVFLLWSYLILRNDHILGCPLSHGWIYNTHLHLLTLLFYMCSHAIVIRQVAKINKPYEFAVSKMGSVLLTLRRLKFFLLARVSILCTWLYVVFYQNAEETYIPVILLFTHLILVIATIYTIFNAVQKDNAKLNERDKLKLGTPFFVAGVVEVVCSILWLMFNVADVHYCHLWYEWQVTW